MCPSRIRSTAVAFGAAAFLLSCGGGTDGGTRPAAVHVKGTLTQTETFTIDGKVSVALEWMTAIYSGWSVDAAQQKVVDDPSFVTTCEVVEPVVAATCDGTPQAGHERCHTTYVLASTLLRPVEYEARFPIVFDLELESRPPAAALYDLAGQGGMGTFAMGVVLAFVDENRDGKLRLGSPGVASEPGLGHSAYQLYQPAPGAPRRAYFVTFLDGTVNPANVPPAFAEVVNALPRGYALWLKEEWVDEWGRRTAVRRSARPIETPIELVTRPEVIEDAAWCGSYDVDVRYVSEIPAGEVPLSCWAGGLGASWWRMSTTGVCAYAEESYWADFTCGGTAPAWNCPGT